MYFILNPAQRGRVQLFLLSFDFTLRGCTLSAARHQSKAYTTLMMIHPLSRSSSTTSSGTRRWSTAAASAPGPAHGVSLEGKGYGWTDQLLMLAAKLDPTNYCKSTSCTGNSQGAGYVVLQISSCLAVRAVGLKLHFTSHT